MASSAVLGEQNGMLLPWDAVRCNYTHLPAGAIWEASHFHGKSSLYGGAPRRPLASGRPPPVAPIEAFARASSLGKLHGHAPPVEVHAVPLSDCICAQKIRYDSHVVSLACGLVAIHGSASE